MPPESTRGTAWPPAAPRAGSSPRPPRSSPTASGAICTPAAACEFYLEYDRGTEAIGALSRKLEGYLRLAAGWTEEGNLTGFPNLLFIVPEGVREGEVGSALCQAIQRIHSRTPLAKSFPQYVGSEDVFREHGVLGPVWRHLSSDSDRLSLVDLPGPTSR